MARRMFSAEFKSQVVAECDRLKAAGEKLGPYLKEQGITAPNVMAFRNSLTASHKTTRKPRKRAKIEYNGNVKIRRTATSLEINAPGISVTLDT